MKFALHASCGCNTGKIRKKNEDNFFFDGKHLDTVHDGLKQPIFVDAPLKNNFCTAVFDGMGGENFGEIASFSAARRMETACKSFAAPFVSPKKHLEELTQQLNDAVVEAQQEMFTDKMGATMVCLFIADNIAYLCNVGDSRAYLLRSGKFTQLSCDHIIRRPGSNEKKPALAQYLGFGSDEILLEPHIAEVKLQKNDIFLLCSDGLSDMLTDLEISHIMQKEHNIHLCVQNLINSALEHGGRDNITAILCEFI